MLFTLLITSLFLINKAIALCDTFRITSPALRNLHWTAGQCYQVSYDLGMTPPTAGMDISVNLVHSMNPSIVVPLVTKEPINEKGATKLFNLNAPESGTYHYQVTLYDGTTACEAKSTVEFSVTVNPHSPPALC